MLYRTDEQATSNAFLENYSFTERKNFIKMHFKAMESSAAVHLRVWKPTGEDRKELEKE